MGSRQLSHRISRYLWYSIVAAGSCASAALLLFSLLPYRVLKTGGDFLSKDGSLETLTPALYSTLHLPALISGLLTLLIFLLIIWKANRSRKALDDTLLFTVRLLKETQSDCGLLYRDFVHAFPRGLEFILLLVIIVVGAAARFALINRPVEYDEAYTYSEFARHTFWHVISDYHVPNNHVFHTILVHFSVLIFGNALWAIRLPAFIAGMLIIPSIYALGRTLYNAHAGLIAAACAAVMPIMLFYSVNARGYTMISLATLLLLILSDYARRKRNLVAWALMVFVTAFGFYTIPIMLYPFGIAVTWLVLSGFFVDIHPNYNGLPRWLGFIAVFGFCAAVLTILMYARIFLSNGILHVFNGQHVVDTLSVQEFWKILPERLQDIRGDWLLGGTPAWALSLLLAGALLSLVLHRWTASRSLVPVLAAALLFITVILVIQRPLILARVWLFTLTLLILFSAGGWTSLIQVLLVKRQSAWMTRAAAAGIIGLVLWAGATFFYPYLINPQAAYQAGYVDPDQVSQYFKKILQPGDVVVVTDDEDADYWYYFVYYQIPQEHIRTIKSRPFKRAYIVSHPNSRWLIPDVISRFGPDLRFFRMDTLKPAFQISNTIVYEIYPYQDAVDRAYGVKSNP